jgi:monovalent cation:proton antiporter-2 (CPA2) family protein
MYRLARFVHTPVMSAESLSQFKDILIVLAAAGIFIPVLLRLGVSSILGFLIVGLVLGPHVLGKLADAEPALSIFSLSNAHGAEGLAELGVVFLLFLIGLELSFERLKTMRRLVFGFGTLQVLASAAAIAAAAHWLGYDMRQALVLSMALALSSTAIIIQLFSDERRLGTQAGRISFSVLLLQDVAVMPMLLLTTALAAPAGENITTNMLWALAQAAIAAALIVIVGRYALTPLLRLVASTKSNDLFLAAVLFIALGAGALANIAGLSMAMGAFIAGLVLAETEYRRAIEVILEPFKGLLLGLFFLLVGLNLDVALLLESPLSILAVAVALIGVKAVVILTLGKVFRLPVRAVAESAMLLGPGGEFAFVILASATALGIFKTGQTGPALLVVTITMMLIPVLAKIARQWRRRVDAPLAAGQAEPPPGHLTGHVLVAGFGRVGQLVTDMLKEQNMPYLAVDSDIANVTRGRKAGAAVYFGDATNPVFLESCGLKDAKALAITMDAPQRAEEIIRATRAQYHGLKIIARARDERHAQKLYEAGATEAVPETIEASLQLAEALLVETGLPMGLAIAAVHERRDQSRKLLGRPNRREEVARARSRLRRTLNTENRT